MKLINFTRIKIIILIVSFFLPSMVNGQFIYISPKPGSKYHHPKTSIILKYDSKIKQESLTDHRFKISSDKKSNYPYNTIIAKNQKTIILKPVTKFDYNETITVELNTEIKLNNKDFIKPFSFSFKTSISKPPSVNSDTNHSKINQDIPENFPSLTINVNDNPADGKIFFHNVSALASDNDRFYSIIENDGTPVFAEQDNQRGLSFTLQKNGYLTIWNDKNFYMLDSSYNVIDSFACGNGYTADFHELQILPNGHSFLMAWDLQTIDMSQIVEGGQEFATVEGLVIQELDTDKNVIFQWRSWDYFNITDAENVDFTTSYVSYVHGNSIEIDADNNIIISSRLMNEITKIHRTTGEIIWRLGGKNNEFTFVDDDEGFCRQHDVRRLPDGNITVYDNGSCHNPKISSAKEYELDEENMTATLVWKYEHPKKIFCETMGNVQRLPNGNTFINWGRIPDTNMTGDNIYPAITEVRNDKSIAYELTFIKYFHIVYRSYRFEWDVENTTSSDDNLLNNHTLLNANIYPNPSQNCFNVSIYLKKSNPTTIKIYKITGQLIEEKTYQTFQGENTVRIKLVDQKPGIYYCFIKNSKSSITKKLILQ